MTITLCPAMAGRFKLVVHKDGIVQRESGWFDNLITDAGLEQFGTMGPYDLALQYCHVGTGTTAPAVGDTALAAYLASAALTGGTKAAQTSAPYFGSFKITYRFNPGTATGNISELGISRATGATAPLFSRALVLDGGGAPTTITVLADETLDVTYELRCYPPLADVTGTIVINGVSTDYTVRACNVTSAVMWGTDIGGVAGVTPGQVCRTYTGAIGAITAMSPAGTMSGGIVGADQTFVNQAYSATSRERAMLATFGLNAANQVCRSVMFQTTHGAYQIEFSPTFTKTNAQIVKFTFKIAWARKTLP